MHRKVLSALKPFVRREAGSVTVDYVVLSAGAVGVGLMFTTILVGGLGTFASAVNGEMSGGDAPGPGLTEEVWYDSAFGQIGDGNGWTGATVSDIAGFGHVLGPITGSGGTKSVTRTFEMPSGTTEAVLDFDVRNIDGVDDEDGIIFIGGEEVGRITRSAGGQISVEQSASNGITFDHSVKEANADGAGGSGKSSFASVRIKVADPGSQVEFGFGSSAEAGSGKGAFALDNFLVSSVSRTDPPAPGGT